MPTTPEEFQAVGSVMLGTASIESLAEDVKLRQAASRTYYAAFHVVHAALSAKARNPNYRINHSPLIGWLTRARQNDLRTIGNLLISAKQLREDADYSLGSTLIREDVETRVARLCKEIIDKRGVVSALVAAEPNRAPNDREGFPK